MSHPHDRPLLLLWGFMGTGKSTLGRRLAERSAVELVDLDERIARAMGMSIEQIFERLGEVTFREKEGSLLNELLDEPRERRIVALGGGALLDGPMRRKALERAWVVALHAPIETIVARTMGEGRPLVTGDATMRRQALADLYKEREHAYRDVHEVLDTDACTPDELATRLWDRWHPCSEDM